jgi:hypothetical protein
MDQVLRTFSDARGLEWAMFARTLPLLLMCACAATGPTPATSQADAVQKLHAVGISRVISPGNGALVRLETGYGPVYVRYPANVSQVAFVLEVGIGSLPAQAEQALAVLVPEAVTVTAANNRLEWLRANPWN